MSTQTVERPAQDHVRRGPHPALVGVVAGTLAVVVAYAVSRYFATGCGAPDAKFVCLLEGIVLGVSAPVLIPLLAWPLLRMSGVRRAFLTALLATAVAALFAYPAQQLALGLHALGGGAQVGGASTTESVLQALAAALAVGAGAGCATALLSGRVTWRAWAVTAAVAVLALAVAGLAERAQADQRLRADLASADVPLLAPPEGWTVQWVFVSESGGLSLDTHPANTDPYGERAVDVRVSPTSDDPCGYQTCRTTDDGLVLVTSETSTTALAEVDGAFVEVVSYGAGAVAEAAVLEVARGLRTVDVDTLAGLAD